MEDLAYGCRAGGRKTTRAGRAADSMPVPGGKFRNGEPIDGTDNGDGDDRSVRATRFGSVMLPDQMEHDRVIRGIEVVPVIAPAPGAQVDLDAAGAKLPSVKKNERVAKIGPETVTPRAAVNDLQGNAVNRVKSVRHRSRMPGGTERDLGNLGDVSPYRASDDDAAGADLSRRDLVPAVARPRTVSIRSAANLPRAVRDPFGIGRPRPVAYQGPGSRSGRGS